VVVDVRAGVVRPERKGLFILESIKASPRSFGDDFGISYRQNLTASYGDGGCEEKGGWTARTFRKERGERHFGSAPRRKNDHSAIGRETHFVSQEKITL